MEDDGIFYNCLICHATISGESGWWDINGEKCLSCQNAVNNGTVPASICGNRESWYSAYELMNKFKISSSSIALMLRDGKLKSRRIKSITGSTTFEIFIKLENEILDTFKRVR